MKDENDVRWGGSKTQQSKPNRGYGGGVYGG
jgi:hypothetical protein